MAVCCRASKRRKIGILTGAAVALLLVLPVLDGVLGSGLSSPNLLFGKRVVAQI